MRRARRVRTVALPHPTSYPDVSPHPMKHEKKKSRIEKEKPSRPTWYPVIAAPVTATLRSLAFLSIFSRFSCVTPGSAASYSTVPSLISMMQGRLYACVRLERTTASCADVGALWMASVPQKRGRKRLRHPRSLSRRMASAYGCGSFVGGEEGMRWHAGVE